MAEKVTEKNSGVTYQQVLTNSATHGIVRQSEYFDRIVAGKNHLDAYYVVTPNDYVYNPRISKEAPCGPINRNTLELTGIASPLYLVFRVSSQSLAYEFLDQYFKTANWFNYMKLQGNSGARSDRFTIADSDFFSMPVRIPSLPEQRRISDFFSTLDSLIAAAERQEALLRQKKQAYLQLMFPQEGETEPRLRFAGFSGEWEQRQLGEVTVERTDRSADGELLSVSMSRGVYPASLSDRKDNSSADKSNYKRLAAGDIVYNSMRMWQGACGLSPYDGIVSPAYTVVAPSEKIDARYLVDLFKSTRMLQKFQRASQGLTSDTWNLKYPAFSKIGCSFPTISEQHRIGSFFSTLDNLIAAAEKRTASLRALKSAYLQRMFV